MVKAVKIEELPVDPKAHLNADSRKSLIKIIESEFDNQSTKFDAQIQEEKDRIMRAYRKRVGFDKLVDDVEEARSILERAEKKLEKVGLNKNGDISDSYGQPEEAQEAGRKLRTNIDKVVSAIRPATNYKNKVITRMLTANTVGQAMVIMQAVLGNGILPSFSLKELTAE